MTDRDIELFIDGTSKDSATVDSRPGGEATATLQWDTTDDGTGQFTARVVLDDDIDEDLATVRVPETQLAAWGGRANPQPVPVYDAKAGTEVYELSSPGSGTEDVGMNSDYIAISDSDYIYVHDLSDGSFLFQTNQNGGYIATVEVYGDFAFYGADSNVYVHDIPNNTNAQSLTDGTASVRGVGASASYVSAGTWDNQILLYDRSDYSLITEISNSALISDIDNSESYLFYGDGNNDGGVYDTSTQNLLYSLSGPGGSVAISESYGVYGSGSSAEVFDSSDGSAAATLSDPSDTVNAVAINQGYIGVTSEDTNMYIYDVSDFSLVSTLTDSAILYGGEGAALS